MNSRGGALGRLLYEIRLIDTFDLVLLFSLLLLIFHGFDAWFYQGVAIMLGIFVLLCRDMIRSPFVWVLFAVAGIAAVVPDWRSVGNPMYLALIWVIAIVLAIAWGAENAKPVLRFSARSLLLLAMGASALWHLLSADFRSGEFFEFLLLADPRYVPVAELLGVDPEILLENREAVGLLQTSYLDQDVVAVELQGGEQVGIAALVLTWWTIWIQAAIALTLLWREWEIIGHFLLLAFIVTSYLIMPVPAYTWLVAIFGMTLSGERMPRFRHAFIASIFLVEIYGIAWSYYA